MKGEIQISIRAYARQLKIDEKAVRKAIDEGKIKRGFVKKTGKILASVADKEWGFVHKTPKPQRGLSKAKVAEKLKDNNDKPNSPDQPESQDEDFSYTDLLKLVKISPTLQYSEAIRRKEILAIAMDKMKIEEMQGLLVRRADVDKSLFAVADQLKKSLQNVPNRIIDDIIAAPNKVEAINILTAEINSVLKTFSETISNNGN